MTVSSEKKYAARLPLFILFCLLLFAVAPASAVIIVPPGFGPDDGTEVFVNTGGTIVVQFENIGIPSMFGFYFAGADLSDPSNLVPIFGPDDIGPGQIAAIDFDLGIVADVDAGMPQSFFTGSGPIGFLWFSPVAMLFTEAALNGGVDVSASLPSLFVPNEYVIAFEIPGGPVVAYEFLSGIRPIPEPATAVLMGIGVSVLFGAQRRRRS